MSAGNLNIGNHVVPNDPIGLREFASFVNGEDSPFNNTVIRLSPEGAEHKFCTTHRDFVGNIGRRQATKDLNNAVREAFMHAILDIYGSQENIPENVKTAMKFDGVDYNTGKPLTARRIRETISAVVDERLATATGLKIEDVKNPAVRKLLQENSWLVPVAKATKLSPQVLMDTGLSQEALQNPMVIKRLANCPELGEKLAELNDWMKGSVSIINKRFKSHGFFPFGSFSFMNDKKVNTVIQNTINDVFITYEEDKKKCIEEEKGGGTKVLDLGHMRSKDTTIMKTGVEKMLGQATGDIDRMMVISKNGKVLKLDEENNVSESDVKVQDLPKNFKHLKGGNDYEGALAILKYVFDQDQENEGFLDVSPIFNQAVRMFFVSYEDEFSLGNAMGLGKNTAFKMDNSQENRIPTYFNISPKKDGGYSVTFSKAMLVKCASGPYEEFELPVQGKLGNPPKPSMNFEVTFDLRRNKEGYFRAENTNAKITATLLPDTENDFLWYGA